MLRHVSLQAIHLAVRDQSSLVDRTALRDHFAIRLAARFSYGLEADSHHIFLRTTLRTSGDCQGRRGSSTESRHTSRPRVCSFILNSSQADSA